MKNISRRSFWGSSAAIAGAFSLGNISNTAAASRNGVQLLEGIERENIKITDVKVTLLSYELPKEKRYFVAQHQWS